MPKTELLGPVVLIEPNFEEVGKCRNVIGAWNRTRSDLNFELNWIGSGSAEERVIRSSRFDWIEKETDGRRNLTRSDAKDRTDRSSRIDWIKIRIIWLV